MVLNLLTKVFGSKNERELKRIQPLVDKINALEPEMQALRMNSLKPVPPNLNSALIRGKTLMTFFRKRLPPSGKPRYAP